MNIILRYCPECDQMVWLEEGDDMKVCKCGTDFADETITTAPLPQ